MDAEVQSSSLFRVTNTSNLTSVKDLAHCLQLFGYTLDDRIERRELVIMYQTLSKEMEAEISSLALTSKYEEAKEMRSNIRRFSN